jgi:UDP-glucose 4-epimerase
VDPEPVFAEARPGEVQRIAIDPARANQDLGWEFRTPIDEGLRQTFESVRASRDG